MLSRKLAIDHIPNLIKGKSIIMRVDFNAPLKNGHVSDPSRIESTIPTINYCLDNGAKSVVLMSHLGRPNGQRNEKFSLKPVVSVLEDTMRKKVQFLNECVGTDIEDTCQRANQGKVVLLENLRFHMEEEGKGVINGEKVKAAKEDINKFRQSLSKLGELYVNDAFGTAHRAHSSVVGVNVDTRAAGLLMKKELQYFSKVMEHPERPLTLIMGGAKLKDKIPVILKMLDLVDEVIIGGGMSYTFQKVLNNISIGSSLFDEEGSKMVQDIMNKAQQKGVKIHFPSDFLVSDKFDENAHTMIKLAEEGIPDGWLGVDIGPKTIKENEEVLMRSKTIFWNGPQGVFEMKPFSQGSYRMLDTIINATQKGAISVIGGGDTASLVHNTPGAHEKISHVSTGGGASLELIEGKELPGIVALSDRD